MVPIIGLIVFLGVYPKPVLDRIEPSVDRLIAHVERGANTKFRVAPRAPEAAGTRAEARP